MTGHMSFLTKQDRTLKFARQVLLDWTKSGLILLNNRISLKFIKLKLLLFKKRKQTKNKIEGTPILKLALVKRSKILILFKNTKQVQKMCIF